MVNALEKFSLKGKIAIVTGGTSGIGKVTAEFLASAGADIAIISRHKDACNEVALEISHKYSIKANGFECDVSNEHEVEEILDQICARMGVPDILFNNAGININGGALDLRFSDWKQVLDINVNGVFLMARAFAKHCISENKGGSIINMASISASIINLPQWQTAYNTSKAAVLHMTRSLAVEWVKYNIRVNAVSPGYVWTEMNQIVPEEITSVWMSATPFHRFAKPEEVACAVIYFASAASSYTSGSELVIDGCFTCI